MSRSRSRSSSYTLHQWSSYTLAGRRAPETQTSLCISDTNCNEFDVPAQVGDSIKTVKSYIHDKTSIPEDQIELWWRGTLLEDDSILTNIKITLDLNVVFRVIVQTISGEEWMVTTEANECVVGLKQAIQKVTEIPRPQQKLVFGTTVLENHRTLSDYGIHSQSVVTLVKLPEVIKQLGGN
jgi:hypothetical protein